MNNNQEENKLYVKESEIHDEKYYCLNKCNNENILAIPHYNYFFVCRENSYSNKLVKLYISSFDYEGVNFF